MGISDFDAFFFYPTREILQAADWNELDLTVHQNKTRSLVLASGFHVGE